MNNVTSIRKRRSRRGKGAKKRSTALATAKKALREINKLRVASGPNLKDANSLDVFGKTAVPFSIVSIPIHLVAQGDGQNQRTGLTINVRSILLDGSLTSSNGASPSMVHLAVVVDKQQVPLNTPQYTDVFESSRDGTNNGLYAVRRKDTSLQRFQVLYSKMMQVTPGNSPVKYFRKYISFKSPMRLSYNAVNDYAIQKNGIYLIAVCDGNTQATVPGLAVSTRFTFDP